MTFTSIPTSGSKVRASVFSALITEVRPLAAAKANDLGRTNNTRTADPDLSIALPANSTWDFEFYLLISAAANDAGDFAGDVAFPANAVVTHLTAGLDQGTLSAGTVASFKAVANTRDASSPTTSFTIGASTTVTGYRVAGRIEVGATPGSLTLNWAQASTNANATTLNDGSYMTCHRVA